MVKYLSRTLQEHLPQGKTTISILLEKMSADTDATADVVAYSAEVAHRVVSIR